MVESFPKVGRGVATRPEVDHAAFLALLGDIHAHLGNTAKAEEIFRDAIGRNPDNDQYYLSLTLVQLRSKDVSGAEQTLQKGLARIPSSGKIQWGLGIVSALEGKTGQAAERPMIAGVFINRLRMGMLLQTDPTVIYGVGDHYDGSLHKRDLQTDTPYNTYTRAGLPPTPIAMPGLEAIRAALNPAQTQALYFVARGNGTHQFSTSLAQHNQAVNRYQRK